MSKHIFDLVAERALKKMNKLQEQITVQAERELIKVLVRWHKRYPRHRFRAWQGWGLLVFDVSPPIGEMTRPAHHRTKIWRRIDETPYECRKGAVKDLYDEAAAITMAHAQLEWKIGTFDSDGFLTGDDRESMPRIV